MMTAKDFRIREDPGPEYSWAIRLWWQHTQAEVSPDDLHGFRGVIHDIHDAVALQNP
jgi:hypothetical protein